MNRMRLFTSVLLFVAAVLGDSVEFVSPGPSVSNSDPSVSNAIHPVRSNFHVAWSGTNASRAVSVVLFQYDGTDLVYPFEYVVQSATNETSTEWTVVTDKNLTFSNLFLFNLFYEGDTSPVAVSETFNITDDSSSSTTSTSATSTSTSFTSSTSSTSSTTFTTSTSTSSPTASSTSAAAAAAASTTGAVSGQSDGMSTGTKVGIGIAVPAVALGGIAVGYYLFRHRAKSQRYVAPPYAAAEQSFGPMEQKPASLSVGPTHARPTYELHDPNGPTMMHELSEPTMMHELSGDATRY